MPIYEYRRKDGTTFEIVQAMSDDALTKDPETGQPVERVFHAPAVHFKGSGFYNTDYGTKRRAREMEKEKSSDNGSGKDGAKAKDKDAPKASGDAKKTTTSSSSGSSDKKKS
jgi:putative FmdB family regulatory protein